MKCSTCDKALKAENARVEVHSAAHTGIYCSAACFGLAWDAAQMAALMHAPKSFKIRIAQ